MECPVCGETTPVPSSVPGVHCHNCYQLITADGEVVGDD